MTPLNELEPQHDDTPTPGRWFYMPRADGTGPMVVSRIGDDVIPVAEYESAADAILCSFAPKMLKKLKLLQEFYAKLGMANLARDMQELIDAATAKP